VTTKPARRRPLTKSQFNDRLSAIARGLDPDVTKDAWLFTSRCPDHKNGGATVCPRGGAALQIWQRKQWGE